MPRKIIKKLMPDQERIKNHKSLKFLGDKLHDPNFWHLNRRSIAMAFSVGLFAAWLPIPGQMVVAALGAVYLRANLPVAVALVWITNPVTIPPLFYFAYRVGLMLSGQAPAAQAFEFSVSGVTSGLSNAWPALLLGCLVMAATSAAAGYFGVNQLWRHAVAKRWARRKTERLRPLP